MKPKQISKRGYLFTFDGHNSNFDVETSVYIIATNRKIFVIDTHCGCDSMEPIKTFIANNFKSHEIIVINTHYDWDHVFGNSAFKDSKIIAHKETHDILKRDWETMEIENKYFCDGDTTQCLPKMLFEGVLDFSDEEISIFHSPGHTHDSISIYDKEDKVLFVADNLEKPLPYLQDYRLQLYIDTLCKYENIEFENLVCTHSGIVDANLIDFTKEYLRSIIDDEAFELDEDQLEVHGVNLVGLRKL